MHSSVLLDADQASSNEILNVQVLARNVLSELGNTDSSRNRLGRGRVSVDSNGNFWVEVAFIQEVHDT